MNIYQRNTSNGVSSHTIAQGSIHGHVGCLTRSTTLTHLGHAHTHIYENNQLRTVDTVQTLRTMDLIQDLQWTRNPLIETPPSLQGLAPMRRD